MTPRARTALAFGLGSLTWPGFLFLGAIIFRRSVLYPRET